MPTKIMEAVDTMADTPIIVVNEDTVRNTEEIVVVDEAVGPTVILHTTVGLTECALIQEKTAGSWQKTTRMTRCGATRCQGARGIAPHRSG